MNVGRLKAYQELWRLEDREVILIKTLRVHREESKRTLFEHPKVEPMERELALVQGRMAEIKEYLNETYE